jgi:glycosyltransferase 2 family protein
MGESERKVIEENALVHESPRPRRWWRRALGYTLAAVCLYWVLRDLNLRELLRRVAEMDLLWVGAAVLFDVLSYVCQGLRWKLLLRPVGRLPVLRTTQAIYAGLFVNEMLPMKVGEIVRAFLISRWTSVKLSSVVPSILLERLFDGVWLAVGIVMTILFVPLPRKLVEAGDVFGVAILVALVIVTLFALGGRRPSSDNPTRKERFLSLVQSISFEVRVAGQTRGALLAFVLSLLLLLLQGFSFWFVMRAYGLQLSFAMGLAVFIIVHLGTLVPTAPANVGSYQFFTVLGLTLFGVEKQTAAGFSLVVFTVLTVPLWAIGLWALGSSGLTLFEVRSQLVKLLKPAKLRQAISATGGSRDEQLLETPGKV